MTETWEVGNLSVSSGEKVTGHLQFPTLEEQLPTFLIKGKQEGPKVLILGGIHGCEYTSIDAALQLGRNLQPHDVKGSLVVIPIANPASFYARSIYVHPQDGKNLNRMFPGDQHGTEAERLAYWLTETCFEKVDYIIDLHGGDMIEALVPFTIYHVTENTELVKKSKRIASLYDIQYVIGSSGQVPGSTYGCAAEKGKVAIIAEAGQQGVLSETESKRLQKGTRNILKSIGMVEGEVTETSSTFLSVFDWYRATYKGLWYPAVTIGDIVQSGDLLGKITDEFGETLVNIYSRTKGIVLFLVTSLAINENDPLLAVGE
ncbi:succinylglutamate desuccinylase [Bacillus sp. BGMRC 2118]|nr:succinylglutamate desuccinylase [Bacillus sp. BGMRC 2118]